MSNPNVVTSREWRVAIGDLRASEKEATRAHDAVATQLRWLFMLATFAEHREAHLAASNPSIRRA